MKRITWTQLNMHASLRDIVTDKYSYSNAKEMHDTFYCLFWGNYLLPPFIFVWALPNTVFVFIL